MSGPTRRVPRFAAAAALGCAWMLAGGRATAQPPPQRAGENAAARADRLFREGKAALEHGRYLEACPKLAESQQLDPGTGTLLALALCHEGEGKTASAWREFGEVLDASERAGRADRAAMARDHRAALEPRLSKLTVQVAGGQGEGVSVRLDGEELPPAKWGTPLPVDPGDHRVEASAPGQAGWSQAVTVRPSGDSESVTVPALGQTAAPAPPPQPAAPTAEVLEQPEPAHAAGGNRTLGWVLGGAGVAAIGVGAFFGVRALSDHGDATRACPSSPCADAAGVSANDRAKTEAWVADFGIGLGLASAAAGAYLLFIAPAGDHAAASTSASARVVPSVGPHGAGLSLSSAW